MRTLQLARWIGALATFPVCFAVAPGAEPRPAGDRPELDRKVQAFLSAERGRWDYLNVPYQDGRILHELERALANLKRAGVAEYADARLGDAHDLVKSLPGPWDFVFQDADKEWYLQYFLDLEAKLSPGGCYTAHNVARPAARQVTEFLEYAKSRPGFGLRFAEGASSEGISISCRSRQSAERTRFRYRTLGGHHTVHAE